MAALAVSLGDPAGIGPEIIAESWARRHDMALAPFFVLGGAGVLAEAAGGAVAARADTFLPLLPPHFPVRIVPQVAPLSCLLGR